ncbi:MAG: hypothetical protein P8189_23115 [Anaerolineae bacterium]
MRESYTPPDNRAWRQARRSAFVRDILAPFAQRPADLMSFGEVHRKLRLSHPRYLGLQDVPLDTIVGSVGRYTDFNRFFLPRRDHLQERWQRIDQLYASGRDLPPIELYKVGQAYFVRDGNHRVSVARQHALSSFRAIVWEYRTHIPLEPDSNVDDLLRKAAHAAFVERTHIDHLRPGMQIELTQPDGYEVLLREVQAHQQIFSRIERRKVPSDEATGLWYDIRYTPIVEIIRRTHIRQHFPDLTETDLYLHLRRTWRELEASHGHHIFLEEAAHYLNRRFGKNPVILSKGFRKLHRVLSNSL